MLIGAAAVLSFLGATPAFASTIIVTQKEPVGDFGSWTITAPSGAVEKSNGTAEQNVTVNEVGSYTFSITPKNSDASLTTVIMNGTTEVATSHDRIFSFPITANQTYTAVITYSYSGTVTVTSEPSGVAFEMLVSGMIRLTGTTPQTFTDLPSGLIKVTYSRMVGCGPMGQQQRSLAPGASLTFFGQFTCSSVASSSSSSAISSQPQAPASIDANTGRTVSIWTAAQQGEALPGSIARFTITVKNTGTRSVHGVIVSGQVDPAILQLISPALRNGAVDGGIVSWQIPEILVGKFWTVTVPMTVAKNLAQGTSLTLNARVSANDLAQKGNILTAQASINTVTALPQTGVRFDLLFLALSLAVTTILAAAVRKTQKA